MDVLEKLGWVKEKHLTYDRYVEKVNNGHGEYIDKRSITVYVNGEVYLPNYLTKEELYALYKIVKEITI